MGDTDPASVIAALGLWIGLLVVGAVAIVIGGEAVAVVDIAIYVAISFVMVGLAAMGG